jgi:hypothetical protein
MLLLICNVSLIFQSAIDVTINNQCTSIELIFSACFIKDAACHMQFPRKVNANRIMKANFITGADRDTFGGALLYHLQQKDNTPISIQLLVIWRYNTNRLYSNAWLIEHENTLVWNENELEKLYSVYSSLYNIDFNTEEWLLDDKAENNVCVITWRFQNRDNHFSRERPVSSSKTTVGRFKKVSINSADKSYVNLISSVYFFIMYFQYLFIISVQISN